jgi:RimJ/RimL family protein N-acetyltransferase
VLVSRLVVELTAQRCNRAEGPYRPWSLRLRADGLLIGGAGFRGPPDVDGSVEIGYGLAAEYRGQGLASEAVKAIVHLAFADLTVHRVVAGTSAGNHASQRVLERNGFTRAGVPGPEVRFALERLQAVSST